MVTTKAIIALSQLDRAKQIALVPPMGNRPTTAVDSLSVNWDS